MAVFLCLIAALLTMATAFADSGNPVVPARFAPELTPSGMISSSAWDRTSSVELHGFAQTAAQKTGVRVLWNEDWIFFGFDCADGSIVSPGEEDGLDHFRLGDTAEVFIAPRGVSSYAEVHATPAGRKTLYFCRDYREPTDPPRGAGKIHVTASRTARGWRAFVAVPRALPDGTEDAREYEVFFARYDYASVGGKPMLSSFPAQNGDKPDFHRRSDYAILRLMP